MEVSRLVRPAVFHSPLSSTMHSCATEPRTRAHCASAQRHPAIDCCWQGDRTRVRCWRAPARNLQRACACAPPSSLRIAHQSCRRPGRAGRGDLVLLADVGELG
jgi:hypothetical protein